MHTLFTRIGLPKSFMPFMILHAYSASASPMNSQNPKPWWDMDTLSLGRWRLAAIQDQHAPSACCPLERV